MVKDNAEQRTQSIWCIPSWPQGVCSDGAITELVGELAGVYYVVTFTASLCVKSTLTYLFWLGYALCVLVGYIFSLIVGYILFRFPTRQSFLLLLMGGKLPRPLKMFSPKYSSSEGFCANQKIKSHMLEVMEIRCYHPPLPRLVATGFTYGTTSLTEWVSYIRFLTSANLQMFWSRFHTDSSILSSTYSTTVLHSSMTACCHYVRWGETSGTNR